MAVLVLAIAVLAGLSSLSDGSKATNDIDTSEERYQMFETIDTSFEIDAGNDEALLQFTAPITSDCIVEYGQNDGYGEVVPCRGARPAQEALLTGLEPNATYHYRVILLDTDGRFYRSRDATFRFEPVTIDTEAVGSDAPVVVNASDESPVNILQTASDEDEETIWEPESGNESFITFTFDEEKRPWTASVSCWMLRTRQATSSLTYTSTHTVTVCTRSYHAERRCIRSNCPLRALSLRSISLKQRPMSASASSRSTRSDRRILS